MDQDRTAEREAAVSKLAELARQEDNLGLGDHLRAIEKTWDRKVIRQVAEEAGIKWEHARQTFWVSKKIPPGHPLRQTHLTYSHLRAVADTDDPEKWGLLAVENNWSVARLKKEIDKSAGKKVPEKGCPKKIKDWESLKPHPAAEIFPLLEGEGYDQLCRDIAENGLVEPIWVCQCQILDGRNRHRACRDTRVEPRFREYQGADPLGHVVSLNVQRRHLDESQRAMVASKLATLKKGQRADTSIDGSAVTQAAAAKRLNVSLPSVQRATKVRANGIDEIIAAVEKGEMAVSAAAELVELPKEQQEELFTHVRQEAGGKIRAAGIAKAKRQRQGAASATPDGQPIPTGVPNPGGRERPPHLHHRMATNLQNMATNLELVAQEMAARYSPEQWCRIDERVCELHALNGPNSKAA
jgi:ParB-like chromosome segregation protein Spo0J